MLSVVLLAAVFYGIFLREDMSLIEWVKTPRQAGAAL